MRIMGMSVDSSGSTRVAMSGREGAAMVVWFRNRCGDCCSPPHRLERLRVTSGAAFLFGAGGWALSHHVGYCCSVIGGRWLRAMMRGNDTRGKMCCDWAPAATTAAKAKLKHLGVRSLWKRCCQAVCTWMGYMTRATEDSPAAAVLRWRCPVWWRTYVPGARWPHRLAPCQDQLVTRAGI